MTLLERGKQALPMKKGSHQRRALYAYNVSICQTMKCSVFFLYVMTGITAGGIQNLCIVLLLHETKKPKHPGRDRICNQWP